MKLFPQLKPYKVMSKPDDFFFKLENKGIAFKARWFVRLDIKYGRDHYLGGISRKNNGHACMYNN